jgi:hypothetical protein
VGQQRVAHQDVYGFGSLCVRREEIRLSTHRIGPAEPARRGIVVVRITPPDTGEADVFGDLVMLRPHAPVLEVEEVDVSARTQCAQSVRFAGRERGIALGVQAGKHLPVPRVIGNAIAQRIQGHTAFAGRWGDGLADAFFIRADGAQRLFVVRRFVVHLMRLLYRATRVESRASASTNRCFPEMCRLVSISRSALSVEKAACG